MFLKGRLCNEKPPPSNHSIPIMRDLYGHATVVLLHTPIGRGTPPDSSGGNLPDCTFRCNLNDRESLTMEKVRTFLMWFFSDDQPANGWSPEEVTERINVLSRNDLKTLEDFLPDLEGFIDEKKAKDAEKRRRLRMKYI
tara:strand:+ start:125 stop:541 length:417 start_codon:yes stop_codon:yes gene_type:complete